MAVLQWPRLVFCKILRVWIFFKNSILTALFCTNRFVLCPGQPNVCRYESICYSGYAAGFSLDAIILYLPCYSLYECITSCGSALVESGIILCGNGCSCLVVVIVSNGNLQWQCWNGVGGNMQGMVLDSWLSDSSNGSGGGNVRGIIFDSKSGNGSSRPLAAMAVLKRRRWLREGIDQGGGGSGNGIGGGRQWLFQCGRVVSRRCGSPGMDMVTKKSNGPELHVVAIEKSEFLMHEEHCKFWRIRNRWRCGSRAWISWQRKKEMSGSTCSGHWQVRISDARGTLGTYGGAD